MHKCLLLSATLLFSIPIMVAADAKDDENALAGTWQATAVTKDGKEAPAAEVSKHVLTVKGDQFRYEMFRTIVKGKMKLNPATTPKEFDLVDQNSGRKGIYERKGNTLRLCIPTRSGDRPTEFTGKAGFQLSVFKKVK